MMSLSLDAALWTLCGVVGSVVVLGAYIALAPIAAVRPVGSALGWIVGTVFGWRRRHVEGAMARAGVHDPVRTANAMYRELGRGFLELLWLGAHPHRPLHDLVDLNEDTIEQSIASGKGAVIATMHAGNWDLLACATAAYIPLTVVTKRVGIETFDRLWQGGRRARGVRLVSAGEVWSVAREALAEGGAVAMMIDQTPLRKRGVVLGEFLGAPAYIDLAPALIAMRSRRPIVFVVPSRLSDGTITAGIDYVVEPPERAGRAWAEETMLELSRRVERHVLARPEQWLWMHHRWADAPEPSRESSSSAGRREARKAATIASTALPRDTAAR